MLRESYRFRSCGTSRQPPRRTVHDNEWRPDAVRGKESGCLDERLERMAQEYELGER